MRVSVTYKKGRAQQPLAQKLGWQTKIRSCERIKLDCSPSPCDHAYLVLKEKKGSDSTSPATDYGRPPECGCECSVLDAGGEVVR